eukprot:TRINITY_DN28169_c0_g1_i2.p1 TRINITY_DN28169_c0_g1~~TRINITY_DN28169_c0_g1_i2.p1  ORF type:complete len:350 (+),score=48.02 TRINITY_DN28169_c0_g1_i2:72-1121(+)
MAALWSDRKGMQLQPMEPFERMLAYAPLDQFRDDPWGPLAGYSALDEAPWGGPVLGRLCSSIYPVLELCQDAYFVSLSPSFRGQLEFDHHLDAVTHFIMDGADTGAVDEPTGGSCLHFAAGSGCEPLCRLLLQAGIPARASARDKRLRTPFWWALAGGHREVCRLLINHSPNVAVMPDIERMLPLHEAASLGVLGAVKLLLPHYRLSVAAAAVRPRPGVDVRGGVAMKTALHLAAEQFHYQVCMELLEANADPQVTCSHGKTALHYAAECGVKALELCAVIAERRPLCKKLRDASGHTPADAAKRLGRLTTELRTVLQGQPPSRGADWLLNAKVRTSVSNRRRPRSAGL